MQSSFQLTFTCFSALSYLNKLHIKLPFTLHTKMLRFFLKHCSENRPYINCFKNVAVVKKGCSLVCSVRVGEFSYRLQLIRMSAQSWVETELGPDLVLTRSCFIGNKHKHVLVLILLAHQVLVILLYKKAMRIVTWFVIYVCLEYCFAKVYSKVLILVIALKEISKLLNFVETAW